MTLSTLRQADYLAAPLEAEPYPGSLVLTPRVTG
jgi:hypothetical protein